MPQRDTLMNSVSEFCVIKDYSLPSYQAPVSLTMELSRNDMENLKCRAEYQGHSCASSYGQAREKLNFIKKTDSYEKS